MEKKLIMIKTNPYRDSIPLSSLEIIAVRNKSNIHANIYRVKDYCIIPRKIASLLITCDQEENLLYWTHSHSSGSRYGAYDRMTYTAFTFGNIQCYKRVGNDFVKVGSLLKFTKLIKLFLPEMWNKNKNWYGFYRYMDQRDIVSSIKILASYTKSDIEMAELMYKLESVGNGSND